MKKFSVVVPSTRSETLATAIESILRQTWPSWELIVVGQGKAEGIERVVEKFSTNSRIKYIHIEQNGLSRARNAGIIASKNEFIVMIDDDCEADSNLLEVFAQIFDRYSDVGLIGGALLPPLKQRSGPAVCPAVFPAETIYDPYLSQYHPPKGWEWVGANVAIRRETFNIAGFFDEFLGAGAVDFPAAEDTDYKLRLEKKGIKMASTPRAIVIHTNGYRYGFQEVMRLSRNYAFGNCGLAGKLTLLGDPRGIEWMKVIHQECLRDWFPRIQRLPANLYRLYNSNRAYKKCLQNYVVRDGFLQPRKSNQP